MSTAVHSPFYAALVAVGLLAVGLPLARLVGEYWAPKVAKWRRGAGRAVQVAGALLSGDVATGEQVAEAGTTEAAEQVRRLPERV
ncbi:hypothetical protein [Streptomyces sp. NPDC054901]